MALNVNSGILKYYERLQNSKQYRQKIVDSKRVMIARSLFEFQGFQKQKELQDMVHQKTTSEY